MITRNAIYTRLKEAALAVSPKAYITGRYMPIPASFPCVFIREIDHSRPLRGMQLDGKDVQWESAYEIQVSSNLKTGAENEAYKVYEAVREEMRALYYRETSLSPVDDGEKFTLAGRFRRVIGGGDTMPE